MNTINQQLLEIKNHVYIPNGFKCSEPINYFLEIPKDNQIDCERVQKLYSL